MKKVILASAIAMMCLSANAFAEDDGYGNDIPAARVEGTVDDGYGNKLPSNEPEYKSFEEARSSSRGQSPSFNIGGHIGFGFGSFWDYPTNEYVLEAIGKNEWINISFDFGGLIRYRFNNMISVVPELNFGFTVAQREVGRGYNWFYQDYKVEETRVLVNLNVPVTVRFNPVPFFYLEAGARVNFNLGTSHSLDLYDDNGNALKTYDKYGNIVDASVELDKWEVNSFVPSIIGGIGGTIKVAGRDMDLGLRVIVDVAGIEKDDKIIFFDEEADQYLTNNGGLVMLENKTKMLAVQFVMNYYLF
jgi:opacity protein-like surface antigen